MDQNQIYDLQTIEVMKRALKNGGNCVDVGCHTGVMMDEMLAISPNGTHWGFEPLPDLFQGLAKKYRGVANVKILNVALSEATGTVSFQHVVSNPGYSGLRKRRYDRPNEVIQSITVSTAMLDDVIPESSSVEFIKIDVEGAELQVFRGAMKTISRCRPVIVFEHGLGAADHYGTEPEEVFDLLTNSCGLRCFTMENWLSGNGANALGRDQFCDEFKSGRNYYFMAAQ
jgi:FkbM family methyltransferase